MEIYVPRSNKDFSERKLQEYNKIAKITNWGRQNPVKFAEEVYGLKLIDFQTLAFMNSWYTPFVCWLECRGAGKDTLASIFLQTKMLLIPDYRVYISCNTHQQAIESMKKLEDIALRRIPSFKSATDIFAEEIEKSANTETGFLHNSSGHKFRLFNNSEMVTIPNNIIATRGKRGSVWFNEVAWKPKEELVVVENFINVDSSFSTTTSKDIYHDPMQMPLQLLYTSSAGDETFPFYEKYKIFSKKMFLGNNNYYVMDINANTVLNNSTIDGIKIKAHLTAEQIAKSIEEDPDLAERELFNKFRKGGGLNSVISMDKLIKNSTNRIPLLYNDTGKKKFILCFDPARQNHGSILSVWQLIQDKFVGYKLQLENVISMADKDTKNKTPLPMPEQLRIIKETMIKYNGEKSADWENIEFLIDAGSGGGGISAIADNLMEDWKDNQGRMRRGVIDPVHKQYETARKKYPNAAEIVTLIEPSSHKKIIYDAFEKMSSSNLINFTNYDNKPTLMIEQVDNNSEELIEYQLSEEEKLTLIQANALKTELSYMCRYDNSGGGVTYEIARDRKRTSPDDRAYTAAMAAYCLSTKRRSDLITVQRVAEEEMNIVFRKPKMYGK